MDAAAKAAFAKTRPVTAALLKRDQVWFREIVAFHPDDKSKDPDTMERDHATLIANRADDEWANRRAKANGRPDPDAG